MHDGARREIRVSMALAAPQDRRPVREPVRLAYRPAVAGKAIRPADPLQVGATGPLIRKHPLEVQQVRRRAICHPRMLLVGVLGVNRIGMHWTGRGTGSPDPLLGLTLPGLGSQGIHIGSTVPCPSEGSSHDGTVAHGEGWTRR